MRAFVTRPVHPAWHAGVVAAAALLAFLSCRDRPGGWNDASRLAGVESLVERGTFRIDASPFAADTYDKLFIDGHFYSDKSPVPAVVMAGAYGVHRAWTGIAAADDPVAFNRFMTLASSGIAFVLAVWSVFALGTPLRLERRTRLLLTASFGLCTLAPVYAEQVNNHILLLGVCSVLTLLLAHMAQGKPSASLLLGAGLLTGLGYAIDLGVGPPLVACTGLLIVHRVRTVRGVALFVLGAMPWMILHHALNYSVGGSWKPANAVAGYLIYPGSPFNEGNMTGGWKHSGLGRFIVYALALLFGKKGLFGHSLPLFLVLPAIALVFRRRMRETPEMLWALAFFGGTWLMYSAASNNASGMCCSVRWFVPLLAPGYLLIAVLLRERPETMRSMVVLSAAAFPIAVWMMVVGPWHGRAVLLLWPMQAVAFAGCWWTTRRPVKVVPLEEAETLPLAA